MKNKIRNFGRLVRTAFLNRSRIFHFHSPVVVVAILVTLMAAFFIISRGISAATVGEQVETGLGYGRVAGLGDRDVREVIFFIINILLGFASVVAVLIIIYAGFVWMTSGGDPQKIERAKKILVNAVVGLILIFTAYSIAAFIIRVLLGGIGPGQRTPPPPPPLGGCSNCGALGSEIIESVFPPPASRDVPRDTVIIVTFKEVMETSTLCQNAACTQGINDGADNVSIFYRNPDDQTQVITLDSGDVSASTSDNKTFVFRPLSYLGDGRNNVIYTVRFGQNIRKQADVDGQPGPDPAFPGVNNFFSWWFEVGTRLDLHPPAVSSVYPVSESTAGQDDYTVRAGAQAEGFITLRAQPNVFVPARITSFTNEVTGAPASGTVEGSYFGESDAKICLTANAATSRFTIRAVSTGSGCGGAAIALDCLNNSAPVAATVVVGCGLSVEFDAVPGVADQYSIEAEREIAADTIRVSSKTFTFVTENPGANAIAIGADIQSTAIRIRDAVNASVEFPDVIAGVDAANPLRIHFTAALAGETGNDIRVETSGTWATPDVSTLAGGVDSTTDRTVRGGAPDESRDVVIRVDFTEAILPTTIGGEIRTNDARARGVGTLVAGDFNMLEVFVDWDQNAIPDADEHVSGTWRVSNSYRTAEFVTTLSCGVCPDGISACTSDGDCAGGAVGSCSIVRNSCGDVKKCLPVPSSEDVIGYIVRLNTARLLTCNINDPATCRDPDYSQCVASGGAAFCQNAQNIRYPKAADIADGVVDTSANSLDGTKVNGAEGRRLLQDAERDREENFFQDIPEAGFRDVQKFDGYEWRFNINKTINIDPPFIEDASPNQDEVVSLLARPAAQFNKIMMSSSLKPDNSYRDGTCGCINDQECFEGEYCDQQFNLCRRTDQSENFCRYDTECRTAAAGQCKTQDYVTLIDTLQSVGYMVGGYNIDDIVPADGFADKSVVEIAHSLFTENQSYHVDIGSGVKDIYQNCFLPATGEACTATADRPYCCYGAPSATPCVPQTRL